jgi:predicted dehydrogenase
MTDRLTIGLIGCGGQGGYLSEAAAICGRAQLVACADVSHQRAAQFAEKFGYAQAYGSAEEMLQQADIDAVIVATTHDQLQPMALAAVHAGKHALVEKPMALNAKDGQVLVQAARDNDVKLMVGYTLRFLPPRLHMKTLLDEDNVVGDVCTVLAGQMIGAMGGWLGQKEHGGGPVFYVGTHALDQILWIVDVPVKRVYAEIVDRQNGDVEAEAVASIRFGNGVIGQLVTSQRMGGRYGWLDVVGSAGRLRTEWESNELYIESRNVPQYSTPTRIQIPPGTHHPQYPQGAGARLTGFKYVRSWAAEITEFAEAIAQDRQPSVSGDDGLRALRVVDAMFKSAQECAPVDLQ